MRTQPPWEITPALQPDRLNLVRDEIRRIRDEVADATNLTEKGDTPWVIGCRAYSWICAALTKLAKSGEYPWPTTVPAGLYFSLRFDGEPVRIYRGDPDEPPGERQTRAIQREIEITISKTLPLFSSLEERSEAGWCWLMATDTDQEGRLLNIGVYQANDVGEKRNLWFLDDTVAGISVMKSPRKAVDQAPPDVEIIMPRTASENDNGDGSDDSDGDRKD